MSGAGRRGGRPSVVAIGGGHGTAVTLKAARRYAGVLTGVVSVADDGGSSGRLRELLNIVALGDLRKCLVAVADEDSALADAFERRYDEGELAGHALGNLILAGLIDATGDLVLGVAEAARLLGAHGDVLPATSERVVLKAEAGHGTVNGQVAVKGTTDIQQVSLVPGDALPPPLALERIAAGGPGRHRPGVPVHQRVGRRGGGRHRRGGGLRPRPRSSTSATCTPRCPKRRDSTSRTTSRPWPGIMCLLTWSCVTASGVWASGRRASRCTTSP